jgi:acyl carrier protein
MTELDTVGLFAEILETDDIIADDNFFDLGGNSILALSLIMEIEKRHGVSLGLIDVIRAPTPRGVADLITRARQEHPAVSGSGRAAAGPAV